MWKALWSNCINEEAREHIQIFLLLLEKVLTFGSLQTLQKLDEEVRPVTKNTLLNLLTSVVHYFSTTDEIDIIANCFKCLLAYAKAVPLESERITRELIQGSHFSKVLKLEYQ